MRRLTFRLENGDTRNEETYLKIKNVDTKNEETYL